FFLKRKPAYEFVRCLSFRRLPSQSMSCWPALPAGHAVRHRLPGDLARRADQIGKAAWRERREISGGAGSFKKKKTDRQRLVAKSETAISVGYKGKEDFIAL